VETPGKRRGSEVLEGDDSDRDGVEAVGVETRFPLAVLIEVDLEFGVAGDDDLGHLRFPGPTVARDSLLDRAGGVGADRHPPTAGHGADLVREHVEQGRVPVVGEEGLLHRDHVRLEVADQAQNHSSSLLEDGVRRLPVQEHVHVVVEEAAAFQERHAQLTGAGIDGQDALVLGHARVGYASCLIRSSSRQESISH